MNLVFFLFLLLNCSVYSNNLETITTGQIEKELQKKFKISKQWFEKGNVHNNVKPSTVKKEKSNNNDRIKSDDDWIAKSARRTGGWIERKKTTIDQWQKYRLSTLKRWQNKKKRFHKDIKTYKKNSVKLPVKEDQTVEGPYRYSSTTKKKIVPNAFYRKTLDQGARPTCVSFAAIRGIEIHLAKKYKNINLSEQYFYYISKPECKRSPCSVAGSWATSGLKEAKQKGLTTERNCPYQNRSVPGNETQIPLKPSCYRVTHKVEDFYKIKSINKLVESLDKGHPVVAGMKLTENFYKNDGVVEWKPDLKKGKDGHADGHAALIIGYYKLPANLYLEQGNYCFLLANSWGEGWGVGGHACLTEKWFEQQRYKVSMLAISGAKKVF